MHTPASPDAAEDLLPPAQPDTTDREWDVAWHRSLRFGGLVALALLALWLGVGVVVVMQRQAKTHLEDEAYRLIEQMGNTVVSGLDARLRQIEALDRSVATAALQLPHDVATFQNALPHLIDFGRDAGVAGGGFWPEPFAFDAAVERRSFFWGRDTKDVLPYFDDYNQPGPGYHHEEWYVPAKHSAADRCYWSQSYTDPYSYQPMVTCTVPVRDADKLVGVNTIDLRLEGLAAFARGWSQRTGGYIFLVDRHNRFITFADPKRVRRESTDAKGNKTAEFVTADEFAAQEPEFGAIAQTLAAMNDDIVATARRGRGAALDATAHEIDEDSYQIDAKQAQLIAAVLTDPLAGRYSVDRSTLYRSVALATDPVLHEPSSLFLFHVPGVYWKLGIVKPVAETVAVADAITRTLILSLLATIAVAVVLLYFVLQRRIVAPLTRITGAVRTIGGLLKAHRHHELGLHTAKGLGRDEIGYLGEHINQLAEEIVASEGRLAEANALLEQRVQERTEELSRALAQLKSSQAHLVQSEKMASLGQMVAGIAHEINTPLGYVKNNLLLGRDLVQRLLELVERAHAVHVAQAAGTEQRADYVRLLAECLALAEELQEQGVADDATQLVADALYGVEQITELVLNLRNFARVDEAHTKEVDIHECIEAALNIARNVLKHKVEIFRDYATVPRITCAPSQLNQVFINLFNNAAQAIDERGKLLVKTYVEDGWLRIVVQDTGRGIPKELLPRIFEPFFTTKPVGQGTGLGLSISYQIVERHHGRIQVASQPGRGTRFVISLPLAAVDAASPPAALPV